MSGDPDQEASGPIPGSSNQIHTTNFAPSQNNQGNVDCTITQNVHLNQKEPPVTKLPGCNEPPANFTGRSKFLVDLHENLVGADKKTEPLSRLCVITGLGGIGKSTVARKYAQNYKDEYFNGNVAWINAETRGSATNSFREIATELKIDNWEQLCSAVKKKDKKSEDEVEKDQDDAGDPFRALVDGVYKHLNTHKEAFGRALFILDNAQQLGNGEGEFEFGLHYCLPKKYFGFLPVFLATSRTRYWGFLSDKIKTRPLEKLARDESEEFICTTLCISEEDVKTDSENKEKNHRILDQFCDIFDGFPLGLKLATGVISSDWSETTTFGRKIQGIENYIREFNQNVLEWAEREIPDTVKMDHELVMSNIWEISIKRIKSYEQDGALSLRLLQLCAFLPTDGITCRLLHFMYNNINLNAWSIKSLAETACKDTLSALQLLQKFSMVELDEMEDCPEENLKKLKREASYYRRQDNAFQLLYTKGFGTVHIHRLVQTMERAKVLLEGERLQNCNPNSDCFKPTAAILRFLFQNMNIFYNTEVKRLILDSFQDDNWPNDSYKDYLALSYLAGGAGLCHPRSIPEEVHDFLQGCFERNLKLRNERDENFLVLCKFLVIYQHNYLIFNDLKKPELTYKVHRFSLLVKGIRDVSLCTFLHWLLDKAQKDLDNRWLQAETVKIFDKLFEQNVIDSEQNEFNEKLVLWLKNYHTEVLWKPKPIPPEFEYQRPLEQRFKNMQTTSELLFKLAARYLSMDEAIKMLVKTVEVSTTANGQQQHEEFNCWRYFDNNLFHVPGIPWDFCEKTDATAKTTSRSRPFLETLVKGVKFFFQLQYQAPPGVLWGGLRQVDGEDGPKSICKTFVQNKSFLETLVKCLEIFTKNIQNDKRLKRKFEADKVQAVKKLEENSSIPCNTIHLISLLTHFDEPAKDMLTAYSHLPQLLKDALCCFIYEENDAKVSHLVDKINMIQVLLVCNISR